MKSLNSLLSVGAVKSYLSIPSNVRGKLAEYRALETAAIDAAVDALRGRWNRKQRDIAKEELSKLPEIAPLASRIVARLFPRVAHKLGKDGQAKLSKVVAALGASLGCFTADEVGAARDWLISELRRLTASIEEKAEAKAEKSEK